MKTVMMHGKFYEPIAIYFFEFTEIPSDFGDPVFEIGKTYEFKVLQNGLTVKAVCFKGTYSFRDIQMDKKED